MTTVTLPKITSGYNSVEAINAAIEQIEDALNQVLSRLGATGNQMGVNLDMNSNRILNCPSASTDHEPVTLQQLRQLGTVVLYEPNPHTHPWSEITFKPTTFPPATHTHVVGDIPGLPTTLTTIETNITNLQAAPRVFVQSTEPTTPRTDDLWIF